MTKRLYHWLPFGVEAWGDAADSWEERCDFVDEVEWSVYVDCDFALGESLDADRLDLGRTCGALDGAGWPLVAGALWEGFSELFDSLGLFDWLEESVGAELPDAAPAWSWLCIEDIAPNATFN